MQRIAKGARAYALGMRLATDARRLALSIGDSDWSRAGPQTERSFSTVEAALAPRWSSTFRIELSATPSRERSSKASSLSHGMSHRKVISSSPLNLASRRSSIWS